MTFIITTVWFIVGLYYLWRHEMEYLGTLKKDMPFILYIVILFFGSTFLILDCFKHGFKILDHKKYTLSGELKTK